MLFGSDIGHFDVQDMKDVVPEAFELVEDDLITSDDFRDFMFTNPVRFFGARRIRTSSTARGWRRKRGVTQFDERRSRPIVLDMKAKRAKKKRPAEKGEAGTRIARWLCPFPLP